MSPRSRMYALKLYLPSPVSPLPLPPMLRMLGRPAAVCGTSDGSKNMSSSVVVWSPTGAPAASNGNSGGESPHELLVLPLRHPRDRRSSWKSAPVGPGSTIVAPSCFSRTIALSIRSMLSASAIVKRSLSMYSRTTPIR